MSPEVVDLLLSLLDQISISGGDPDLLRKAAVVAQARREVIAQNTQENVRD